MKKIFLLIIFLLITINTSFADTIVLPSEIGTVQNIKYEDIVLENNNITKQVVDIKITKGKLKDNIISTDNVISGNPNYDIKLKKGSKVILHTETDGENLFFSIADIERAPVLGWLTLIFCGLLLYVGKKKGLYSLVSIILTCILISKILIPIILIGINPVIGTVLVCIFSTAITMYLVGGFNRKSTSATIGCTLSLIFAGTLSLLTVKLAHLTGFHNEHTIFLFSTRPDLNFISILVSTMMLATLGAVMDVAMSIASTINEIYTVDSSKTVKELFVSGMNVGRDIIGTMANTLILVYLGGALPLLLLASNIDFNKFINLNQVVTEISSALIGSCAIVVCVPITAFVASELIKNIPANFEFKKTND